MLAAKLQALSATVEEGCCSGVPPQHEQSLLLWRNLARCHAAAASSGQGTETSSSAAAFPELMCRYLLLYEAAYGVRTNQRDKGYLQGLHQILSGAGAELPDRALWREKLERACLLQFGERALPESLRD